MGDLSKKKRRQIEAGLDKIIADRHAKMANILTDNAGKAYSEGDKQAQKQLRVALSVKVLQTESVAYMKEYGSLLKKEGSIMIPVYGKLADGADELLGYTKYDLMKNSATADKKGIMDIIQKEYKEGTPTGLKQTKRGTYPKDSIAAKLDSHYNKQKSHASLVARTETNRITDHGQRIRYQKLGITKARWKTSGDDNVRESHLAREEHGIYDMDKIPSLGEPNCRCSIVPVLDTERKPEPPEKPPEEPAKKKVEEKLKKKASDKPLITQAKVEPDEDALLARTKGGTKYTPEQARQKVLSIIPPDRVKYLELRAEELHDTRHRFLEASQKNDQFQVGSKEWYQNMIDVRELSKKQDQIIEDIESETKIWNKVAHKVLANQRPNEAITMIKGDGFPLPPANKDQIYAKLHAGLDFTKNIVSEKITGEFGNHEIHYFKTTTGRAFSRANEIHINNNDPIKTVVHEIGHTIEHFFDQDGSLTHSSIFEHIESRTYKEKFEYLQHLTPINYSETEFAKKDKFMTPYMGKYYGWGSKKSLNKDGQGFEGAQASEFLSVSMEYFYLDPIRFALTDPESFRFAFALIKGL